MRKLIRFILESGVLSPQAPATGKQEHPVNNDSSLPPIALPLEADILKDTFRKNDAVIRHYKSVAEEIAATGITDGVNGEPTADSQDSYAENALITSHTEAAATIGYNNLEALAKIEGMAAAAKQSLDNAATKEKYLSELANPRQQALTEAARRIELPSLDLGVMRMIRQYRTVQGVTTALKERLRQLQEQKTHTETRYHHLLEKQYQRIPPDKQWIDLPAVFWGAVAGLFFLEIIVNFTSFQTLGLGDTNLAALMLGLFFAIGQAWSAKCLGFARRKMQKRRVILFLAVTALFCLLISGFRITMEGSWMARMVYLIINFLIAGWTAILAYLHAQHHDFFSLLRRRHRLSARIENRRYQIEHTEKTYRQKCEEVEREINAKAEKLAQAAEEQFRKKIEQYESELEKLDAHDSNCLQQLDAIRDGALNKYRHLNQNARRDNGHPPVQRWQASNRSRSNGRMRDVKNMLTFLLLVWLSGMGCSTPPEDTYIEILYDQTDTTYAQDIDPMLDYILSFVSYDTIHGQWGETTVTLSHIGETSTQFSQSVHLPASESYWLRNELEHRKKPGEFRAELREALVSLTEPGKGMKKSYIHRNFYYRLKELARHNGRRIVLSWSDLIVNDRKINFYDYRENPQAILAQRDSLIALMTKDYPLPNLTGVKLINVHQPPRPNDELHEVCKRYFGYYWESLGIEVEFKTNIPMREISLGKGHPVEKQ